MYQNLRVQEDEHVDRIHHSTFQVPMSLLTDTYAQHGIQHRNMFYRNQIYLIGKRRKLFQVVFMNLQMASALQNQDI